MTAMRRLALLGAAATVVLGATVAGPTPAQAVAGRCASGDGVTVVVDYGPLRSGLDYFCDRDGGGKTAASIMTAAGIQWQYTTGQPFVCRIQGLPSTEQESCTDTPPPNAYWGLFWSDGSPQTWTYASQGASSQRVPDGGSVGWRFQDGGDRENPGAAPTARPKASPSPQPAPKPSSEPSKQAASGAPEADPAPETSAPPSPRGPQSESTAPRTRTEGGKTSDEKGDDRKGEDRDRPPERKRDKAEDVTVLGSEETDEPDGTEASTADSELVTPVGASDEGLGANDVLLLAVAGLAASGLAGYGVLMARRRRT